MKRTLIGALTICIAAALWGFDGVVLTPRLVSLGVPFVIFIIHLIPFLGLHTFLTPSYAKLVSMKQEGWISLLLVALFGGLLGTMALVQALFMVNFEQLSMVILLQKLQPIFAILLAAALLKEKITGRFIGYTTIALVGAYLLTFGLSLPIEASLVAGLLAVLAAAAFGSSTVFSKKLLQHLDYKESTFARYGMTTILAFLFIMFTGANLPFDKLLEQSWIIPNWGIILTIALTTGGGAIFLYYYGLARVKASVSTICELCLPLSAIIFDWLFNGHLLSFWQWIGAIFLIAAIWQISSNGEKKK
jgi:drug/metabolite transporter (DMT)-like permease